MTWRIPTAISFGAVGGALTRYYLGLAVTRWVGTAFPWATLTINVSGSLAIDYLATWFTTTAGVPREIQLMALVGFVSSYTTFSTYGLETVRLWQDQRPLAALGYVILSEGLGVAAVCLGMILGRRWPLLP